MTPPPADSWVLMTARGDPGNQLRWLTEELRAAYLTGEKCHIVGHISPADRDILPAWSHMYYSIIKKWAAGMPDRSENVRRAIIRSIVRIKYLRIGLITSYISDIR